MSELLTPAQQLDQTCKLFIDTFSRGNESTLHGLRKAGVSGLALSLGMQGIDMAFRDQAAQEDFFKTADCTLLSAVGNPSAQITTHTAGGVAAVYRHDRNTDLVIVGGSIVFPIRETRILEPDEKEALTYSIATCSMMNSLTERVLTDIGLKRLTTDIEKALQWYST